MAVDVLIVLLEGKPIGRVERRDRELRLVYDDAHLDDPAATQLSVALSSPLREHTDRAVTPWMWGLLPDNTDVLNRWARELGASLATPFGVLATRVGHDCAGAVQFCRPDALDELLDRPGVLEPLTDEQIGDRLRALRVDSTTWLGPGATGQFSLAGAQAKTALAFDAAIGWNLPHGAAPTTHILKPAIAGLDGHDLNEHLCLAAARRCGLAAARTSISQFDGQSAIVVERFDRQVVDGAIVRIHQEDLCQAMAVHPARKYQADDGPSVADIGELFRSVMPHETRDDALSRFVDALAFNWVIAGTDAHAKNYALLHAGPEMRLAPLYDIASSLPYDTSKGHDLKLAMKLGGEYRLLVTDRATTWPRVANELGLAVDAVLERVARLVVAIPEAFAHVAADPQVTSLASDLPARLVDAITKRAQQCQRIVE